MKKSLELILSLLLVLAGTTATTFAASPVPGTHSPEYTINGSTVTGQGVNPTTAEFGGATGAYYNVTVLPGSVLGNTTPDPGDSSQIGITSGTVTNYGTLLAAGGGDPTGVYIASNGLVTNYGTISSHGFFSFGVYLAGTGEVDNYGLIAGDSDAIDIVGPGGVVKNFGTLLGGTGGEGITFGGAGSMLLNTGTILGGLGEYGVVINNGTSSVISSGGLISGGTGSIVLGSNNNFVALVGRARTSGPISSTFVTGNSIQYDLAGVTPGQAAALRQYVAANPLVGSFTFAGSVYAYNVMAGNTVTINPVSLELGVDSGLQPLAQRLDTAILPGSYDPLYAAAYFNAEGALSQFSGREVDQAIDTNEVNQGTTLAYEVNNHLDAAGLNAGGFDISGLHVSTDSMFAFASTNAQLDSIMGMDRFGGTEMSTDQGKDLKGMASPAEPPRWGAWAAGTVTLATESNEGATPGYHATTGSPMLGIDYHLAPHLLVGALVNYSVSGANFGDGSSLNAQTGLFGLYGAWHPNKFRLTTLVAGGYTSYNIARSTFSGTMAHAHPAGDQAIGDLTGGYDFDITPHLILTPEVGVTYTHVGVDGYTEDTAGIFDLTKQSQDINSLRSHAGFRLSAPFPTSCGVTFIPQLRASYYHEFMDDSRGVSTSVPGASALGSFAVPTNRPERDFALVGIGLDSAFTGCGLPMAAFLNYDVQAGQDSYIAHNIDAGLRVSF